MPRIPRLPGGRLAFERAIRYSSLPAPARHLALTIATWADIETGVIPDRFMPAQSTLEEATGLSRGAVFKHSKLLEADGWLIREGGGGRSKRTKHVLQIPPGAPTSRARYVSPGDMYPENVSPGEPETCHVIPETSHLVNGNVSPGDTKSSLNSFESRRSTSSSPTESVPDAPAVVADDDPDGGGGGGGSLSPSRSLAEYIAGALDYRGKLPDKRQRATIADRLTAALEGGWTMDGLALYLDLSEGSVQSPAAVYAYRLHPDNIPAPEPLAAPQRASGGIRGELPSAEDYATVTLESAFGDGRRDSVPAGTWEAKTARARVRVGVGGTDDRVAGWGAVSRQLAGHKPYSNDAWSAEAIEADAATIPHCGDPDCDPVTRTRDGRDHNDLPYSSACQDCHPRTGWRV